jgi:diguanylate cyclase (GGDEF)-like protein
MLAYNGGLPAAYEPVATLASLLIAIILAACGFALAARGSQVSATTGGLLVGVAIGAMHYTGMAALIVPGTIAWDPYLVAASLGFGIALATAAMQAYQSDRGAIWKSAGFLTAAICSLHFTAMGAVIVIPDPSIELQPSGINRTFMAMAIAGVTLIVLLSALAAAVIQKSNIRYEDALRDQNARFEEALRYLPVGLSMFDAEQRLIMCNAPYREIYDLSEECTRPGTSFSEIMRRHVQKETGRDDAESLEIVEEWIAGHFANIAGGKQFTDTQQLGDGRTVVVKVGPIAGGGWVDIQEDITERTQQEAKIAHMARHDMLTGLPNRLLLRERLEEVLRNARRDDKVAVLCLDLDRFKEVNDTLGHPVGDALLQEVANRLRDMLRERDVVARMGGDEFVIIQVAAEPSKEAASLASRLIDIVSAPYDVNGHKIVIGTSVGIAISPDGKCDVDLLLAQADMALYRSKSDGRATYCFFEEEMNTRVHARRKLEQDLRLALANGEFELHYQPLVNLERNEIAGFEALLRWRHAERGMVSPANFIPIAEETGLILPIGEWVLRQACKDAATWPDHVKVAVNLSPVQFKCRTLADMVFNAVAASGIAASRLELEITETVLLHDGDATLATLRQLHDFGIRIAMDDFGTGYSSLSYLRKFPFHKIKIDRCFIASLQSGDSSIAIVRAISGLGRALGLSITAEGVETQEQLDVVRAEGYTEMQGYFFSAPKPAAEIRTLFGAGATPPMKEIAAA